MITYLILAILFFIAILIWDLQTDKARYKREEEINHSKDWKIRAGLILPSITCFTLVSPGHFILALILSICLVSIWWWILFDGLFNIAVLKVKFWEVIGTTSSLDKLQQHLGQANSKALKILLAIFITLAYILKVFKYNIVWK